MLRAVLDANVYVSALLSPDGTPGRIVTLLLEEQAFKVVATPEILAEVRHALSHPRVRRRLVLSAQEMGERMARVQVLADMVECGVQLRVVASDADDDKYIAAALAGRAGFIVSGDRHLLSLGEYEGIRIVTPRLFLDLLEAGNGI